MGSYKFAAVELEKCNRVISSLRIEKDMRQDCPESSGPLSNTKYGKG